MLTIKNLHATIEDKEILKGINLELKKGEVLAIMGPNGSGKSTLAATIMGDPKFTVTQGSILFDGEEMVGLDPDERARKGLFLSFQHPSELPGVSIRALLRAAITAREGRILPAALNERLQAAAEKLHVDPALLERHVNEGFSGGEKKRAETLQLAVLNPRLAILDETDSGLDVDALRIVGEGITAVRSPENSFMIITHYNRILNHIKPDRVLVLQDGKIAREGGPELATTIEDEGFLKE